MKIYQPSETVTARAIAQAIFGDPGIGKTTLSFTAEAAMVFDYEDGIERADKDLCTIFYRVTAWEEVLEAMQSGELLQVLRDNNIKTIVHDTVGTMIDRQIADYVKKQNFKNSVKGGTALSMDGWMAAEQEFKALFEFLRRNGFDQLFLSHAKGDGKEDKIVFEISGGAKKIVQKHSDAIGYYFADQRGRWLSFEPTMDRIGKNPAGWAPVQVPKNTTAEFATFYADLTGKLKAHLFDQSKKQADAQQSLSLLKAEIQAAETLDMLVALEPKVKALPPMLAMQAGAFFNDTYVSIFASTYLVSDQVEDFDAAVVEYSKLFPRETRSQSSLAPKVFGAIKSEAAKRSFVLDSSTGRFNAPVKEDAPVDAEPVTKKPKKGTK